MAFFSIHLTLSLLFFSIQGSNPLFYAGNLPMEVAASPSRSVRHRIHAGASGSATQTWMGALELPSAVA
ncbi:hypothetical protein TRIUR3_32879 [Triticum urartu]|uniref:Uncharacterized protein n=1 Tax=Triticum urartu TaxID=4572 RepID=M7ZQX2_TRIUA|nr:hypothetical protein TRIUR3_32879 [Triticum urartu]